VDSIAYRLVSINTSARCLPLRLRYFLLGFIDKCYPGCIIFKILNTHRENDMPIYEYLCLACGNLFEKLQKSSAEEVPSCPACGATEVRRELSSFAAPTSSPSHAGCSGGG